MKRVDAMGNVTCFTYDALHRSTDVTYPSGPYASLTKEKHFIYDSATVNNISMTFGAGRLVEAYTGPSNGKITSIGFSYSERGTITDTLEMTPHSNGWLHITNSYWLNDSTKKVSGVPGVPDITYTPNPAGRITTVAASFGQNPVTSASYNAAGQITGVTFGSGDSDSYQYDPQTGRMTQFQFNVAGQYQRGDLVWNSNSSLLQLMINDQFNPSNSQTCNYSHDALGRIGDVNCGSVWQQVFGFDVFGNLTKTVSQSFTPSYDAATNQINGGGYSASYDANGNMTSDGMAPYATTYSWDTNGNPRAITRSGNTVDVIYDALGRAVENQNGSSYTQIVYAPEGRKLALVSGGALVKAFIPLPGASQAVYDADGLKYYRHGDWLGNSRLASTPSRDIYYDGSYAPFGESYEPMGTSDLSYTGQTQDTIDGLYDFTFRRYNPVHGRWVSPDPAGIDAVDPMNPQTWNRYAYVANDPMTHIDPLGLMMVCFWNDGADSKTGYTLDFCIYFAPYNGGGGKPGGGGPRPPSVPKITQTDYDNCANKAFGKTSGGIPGTTKSIPSFDVTSMVFDAAFLLSSDPATIAATMAIESNSNLNMRNSGENDNGTVDVGPMQLNTANVSGSQFHIYGNAYGTNLDPHQAFNGNSFDNIITGAGYLRKLGRHPERYVGTDPRRRGDLNRLLPSMKKFFDCLKKAAGLK